MRFTSLTVLLLALTGCDLIRPTDAPTHRQLEIPWPATQAVAVTPAKGARPLRLLAVTTTDQLGTNLVTRLAEGERRDDPLWRWTTAPHRHLTVALTQAITADPRLVLREDPDADSLRVLLLDCSVDVAARSLHLRAVATLTGTEGHRRDGLVTVDGSWNGELPGDLATQMGSAMTRLTTEVIGFVAGQ